MKKLISICLIIALCLCIFSGCDRRSPQDDASQSQSPDFAPEATAVSSLVQAAQTQDEGENGSVPENTSEAAPLASEAPDSTANEQPIAQDSAITAPPSSPDSAQPTQTANSTVNQPFATPTPQPNTTITNYSEVTGTGLGFKFNYPSDWINIPGYSTVCYVQPTENGTVYPARVSVTMKRLPHKCSEGEDKQELASFIKTLMTQYDEKTFKVDTNLDTETKFMNNPAISTTYLAYDGSQEIQGYVILTYFERYLFCFHFLCAYEDYIAFEPAMRHMRDSVQADQSQAPQE